jgi:hypothetical protein
MIRLGRTIDSRKEKLRKNPSFAKMGKTDYGPVLFLFASPGN